MKKGTLCTILAAFALIVSGARAQAAVTEAEFHQVLNKLYTIYQPRVLAQGKVFSIDKKWSDNTVNAYASNWGDRFVVAILGGIARLPRVTPDSLAVIACHEIGFLFGGEPRKSSPASWASVVGQADYYSTAKCMKHYLADADNIDYIRRNPVPAVITAVCKYAYDTDAERALCARSAVAGIEVAKSLADLTKQKADVSTPSREVATKTEDNFPSAQCRLDTFVAGAACNVNGDDDAYCAPGTIGARPTCWYAEKN